MTADEKQCVVNDQNAAARWRKPKLSGSPMDSDWPESVVETACPHHPFAEELLAEELRDDEIYKFEY